MKDPFKAKPDAKTINKIVLAVIDTDRRDYLLKFTADLLGVNKTNIINGDIMIHHVTIIPFIVVACITSCNVYYMRDIGQVIISLVECIEVLLKFNELRTFTPSDKIDCTKKFVKAMTRGVTASKAFAWAVNNSNVIGYNNNNNNNSFRNRSRGGYNNNRGGFNNNRRSRGRGRGRGGTSRGGFNNWNDRNPSNNNNPPNPRNNRTLDSNNNRGGSSNNKGNEPSGHYCTGFNCKTYGCPLKAWHHI